MLSAPLSPRPLDRVSTIERARHVRESIRACDGILLDVLRTLEHQLQSRGLLPLGGETTIHPVWFLAETERNIFLWRRGCSIIQIDEFEFWVDIPSLVRKRLRALERFSGANPLMNPLWASDAVSDDQAHREAAYLEQFLAQITAVGAHAHALSEVGSRALSELCPEKRETVLLPVAREVRVP